MAATLIERTLPHETFDHEAFKSSLKAVSPESLATQLLDELSGGIVAWYKAGYIVCELEDRGYTDLRKLSKSPLLPLYRRIGRGDLLAEIIVRSQGDMKRIKLLGSLPLAAQRRLVDPFAEGFTDGRVPLLVPNRDGELSTRNRDVFSMSEEEAEQAVDAKGGRLRPEEAQRKMFDEDRKRAALPLPSVAAGGRARIDRERSVAEMQRGVYTVDELEAIVAVLRGRRPKE